MGLFKRTNSAEFEHGIALAIEDAEIWLADPVVYPTLDAYIARQVRHIEGLRKQIKRTAPTSKEEEEHNQYYDGFLEGLRRFRKEHHHR